MSAAVTSPGPSLVIWSSIGSSRSSLNFRPFTLRMMSTTSSLTPGMVENSCATPSILTLVTAEPVSPESITRRSALPSVCPRPRGSGSATNSPRRSTSSSTLKRGGAMSNIVKIPPAKYCSVCVPAPSLAAVELDDELLFDGDIYLVAPRRVQDAARVVVVIRLQPRRDRHDVLHGVRYRLQASALLFYRDHIPLLQDRRWYVVLAPVEQEVPVHHELARLRPARREAHAMHDVVHPKLHEPQQVLAGDALHPVRLVVGAPELLLGDAVVPARLLLLHQPEAVLRLPLPTPAVLTGWVGLPLQRVLPHVREHHPGPTVAPAFRSRVTCQLCCYLPKLLTAAPLRGPASVVRLAGDVPDAEHLYAHALEGPGRHVAARAVALDLDVHAPDPLVHRLVRATFGGHLGRIRRALTAPPETQGARRFPGDDVASLVGDAHDGVVERALDVDDARGDVPADLAPSPARPTLRPPLLLPTPAHLPGLLSSAYGRLGTLALAGVRLRPLPAHREPPAVPDAPVRADFDQPPDVLIGLAPQVALDLDVLVHVLPDARHLALGEVPDLRVRVHLGLAADLLRPRTPDPEDVRQPDLGPLLARQVHAGYTRHSLALPLLVPGVGAANNPHHPATAYHLAPLAQGLDARPYFHASLLTPFATRTT